VATLFAYVSMAILSYYLGKKHYAVPYAMGKILSYLSISILFSVLSFYVFSGNYLIGIAFILSFLILIIALEKSEISSLINKNAHEN
jgi:hypothetical protein